MRKLLFTLLLTVSTLVGLAQGNYITDKFEYTFGERHFFHQMRFGWMGGVSPGYDVTYQDRTEKSYSVIVGLINIGYDPRLNIIDLSENMSLSVDIPVDINLGLAISTPNADLYTGFLAASTGAFLSLNRGYHSTYNNVQMKGTSLSLGYRMYKAPVFGVTDDDADIQRLTFGPSVRFMHKRDQGNENNKVIYFELGIPKILDIEPRVENLMIHFGMGKTINY